MSKTTSRPETEVYGPNAAALWAAITADYDLEQHELVMLRELCRVTDRLDALHSSIDRDGSIVAGLHGPKVNPALTEARQQAIVQARIAAALRMPTGDEGDQPQRRGGTRGVYAMRGA